MCFQSSQLLQNKQNIIINLWLEPYRAKWQHKASYLWTIAGVVFLLKPTAILNVVNGWRKQDVFHERTLDVRG